ncbi:hypothetical protein E2562_011247 [Oryza meyeriana var. granulata]|uniref:EF-hand domain-containing protein n=1 Tax=Oryza meyeriana var. granulata TaxID=110450 RepID=A0A6G1DGP4_9ORYZ|nr:hypothetical protein E2562_011247 [Oryza meyeriana var. granulata]
MAALGLRVNGTATRCSLVEDEALVLLEEKQASWEELEEAFSVFDCDGDGFIRPMELHNVMIRLGLQQDTSHEKNVDPLCPLSASGTEKTAILMSCDRVDWVKFCRAVRHVDDWVK